MGHSKFLSLWTLSRSFSAGPHSFYQGSCDTLKVCMSSCNKHMKNELYSWQRGWPDLRPLHPLWTGWSPTFFTPNNKLCSSLTGCLLSFMEPWKSWNLTIVTLDCSFDISHYIKIKFTQTNTKQNKTHAHTLNLMISNTSFHNLHIFVLPCKK